uniref:Uncharacterized protein n=1 Tax=Calidris pygmaea TaxID=425635 RepID=A0A8C3KGY8_9CHAR
MPGEQRKQHHAGYKYVSQVQSRCSGLGFFVWLVGGRTELVKVQVALSNVTSKQERFKILVAVPDTMKLQFILAEKQVIPSQAALLEQGKNLQPILDSASIQAVPDHFGQIWEK